MLTISNLSLHFGGRTLFDNIAFQVNSSDTIGLVGRNGSGKSTLLKILAGIQKPDSGNINIPKGYTIGYLPQELKNNSDKTIFDEAATAFAEALALEQELEKLNEAIANHTDYESDEYGDLVERLTEVSHRHELIGAATMERDIEQVLTGLGFKRKDLARPMKEFSGGWQMRVELAKILLAHPDLLLLDEPTNHLDIESIIWLEGFLKSYFGAIILVSHDKALLNNITNRTIEIENSNIYDYKANYDQYLSMRALRREKLIAEKKNQDKYIEQTEQLINKFRAKQSKASFAQSLIKKLDKLDRVELDDEDSTEMKIRFPDPPRSGKVVVNMHNLSKAYGDLQVLKNINLHIERGDKIAFVGKNGEGKTTLSKIIARKEPYDGELEIGHNVSIGYFAQQQADLMDGDITVFQTIDQLATGEMRSRVRGLLGAFLFSGEDVDKKVKVLSGGEKGRLALAKLLLEPVNFLVMDEPTNHLDMRSKEVLKNALNQYEGTLVIVSHDRDFLDGLTSKVYEFSKGNIREYLGDVSYFLSKKQIDNLAQLELKQNDKQKAKIDIAKSDSQISHQAKKQLEKEEKRLKYAIGKCEGTILELELNIKHIELRMNEPDFYENGKETEEVVAKYDTLKRQLEKEMETWTLLCAEMEELAAANGDE